MGSVAERAFGYLATDTGVSELAGTLSSLAAGQARVATTEQGPSLVSGQTTTNTESLRGHLGGQGVGQALRAHLAAAQIARAWGSAHLWPDTTEKRQRRNRLPVIASWWASWDNCAMTLYHATTSIPVTPEALAHHHRSIPVPESSRWPERPQRSAKS